MNASPDGNEHMDAVDLLIKIAVFVCFVVFAVCIWFIRRERDRRKVSGGKN
jgi:heme/copper-type cytochrome/quinol oxidase subunit 2